VRSRPVPCEISPHRPFGVRRRPRSLRDRRRQVRRFSAALFSVSLAAWSGHILPADDAAQRWLQALRSRDLGIQLEAAYALEGVGPEATASLVRELGNPDPVIRRYVASALGEIEVEPTQAVPALAAALGDPDGEVREHASVALAKIGPPAVPALIAVVRHGMGAPSLAEKALIVERFNDCFPYNIYLPSLEAALSLSSIGEAAASPLVETLRAEPRRRTGTGVPLFRNNLPEADADTYVYSLLALRRMGRAALSQLGRALADPDPGLRLRAAIAVAWIRADLRESGWPMAAEVERLTGPAAAALAGAARDPGNFERLEALDALGRIGPSGGSVLVELLKNEEVRRGALLAIKNLGPEAGSAVPALIALAGSDSGTWPVFDALAATHSEEAFRFLVGRLGNEDPVDIQRLHRIGGAAAVPCLASALADPRRAAGAADTLGRIGPAASAAVPALVAALKARVSLPAISALGSIGPDAEAAVPALITALAKPALRREAVITLGKIGPHAAAAIPALVAALQDGSPEIRVEAAVALKRMGPAAAGAVTVLIAALGDRDREVRDAAAAALGVIGPRAQAAGPALVEMAARDASVAASEALANIGAGADIAIQQLERLIRSEDRTIHTRAALALARISPANPAAIAALIGELGFDPTAEIRPALERVGTPAVSALVEAARKDPNRRVDVLRILVEMRGAASSAEPALRVFVHDPDLEVRVAAADALLAIGTDPAQGGALRSAINDYAIDRLQADGLPKIADMWSSGKIICMESFFVTDLPKFWPPPRFSAHEVLPRPFLGAEADHLSAVHERLASALGAAGFEDNGLFEVPGGFALVTRVERIREDGTSSPSSRWTAGRATPLNLIDYLSVLFLERPGQFRVIAFLVTDLDPHDWQGSGELSEKAARRLELTGGRVLPGNLGALPWKGRSCHVLIYHFERKHGGTTVLYPSSLSTFEHLRKAGLWERLAR
jgi:HEAT repeat protein